MFHSDDIGIADNHLKVRVFLKLYKNVSELHMLSGNECELGPVILFIMLGWMGPLEGIQATSEVEYSAVLLTLIGGECYLKF